MDVNQWMRAGERRPVQFRVAGNPTGEMKKPRRVDGAFELAHSGGFEPPTARFVAEYSIQLSYECVVLQCRGRVL